MRKSAYPESVIPCTCPDECCIHEPTSVVREDEQMPDAMVVDFDDE